MNDLTFIQDLYDQGLHSNVVLLCDLFITHCDNNTAIIENVDKKFRLLVIFANSLFELHEFERAIGIYRRILLLYKSMKSRSTRSTTNAASSTITSPISYAISHYRYDNVDNLSILDVKFNLHVCYLRTKQDNLALQLLQSIPTQLRSPKINMALGILYRLNNSRNFAISAFMEVMKKCPMSLEAADELLKLGVSGSEINSLMLQSTNCAMNSWLYTWIKGRAQMYSNEPVVAISTFRSINSQNLVQGNPLLYISLGQCFHNIGDKKRAYNYFSRAFTADPYLTTGFDTFASLMIEIMPTDLETMLMSTLSMDNFKVEHWISVAYLMYFSKNYAKAIHFLEKALRILGNRKSFEAVYLKGCILMEMKEFQSAATFLSTALQVDKWRFEPYEKLAECYKSLCKTKERRNITLNSLINFRNDIRAIILYFKVFKDSESKDLLKQTFDKMLDDSNSDVINQSCDSLVEEAAIAYSELSSSKKYGKHVLSVLKKVCANCPSNEIQTIINRIENGDSISLPDAS